MGSEMCIRDRVFQAAAIVIREILSRLHTFDSRTAPEREVHYLSMEFLMGRALGNNMINLMAYDEIKEVLAELVQIAEKYRRDFLPGEFHTLEILETL